MRHVTGVSWALERLDYPLGEVVVRQDRGRRGDDHGAADVRILERNLEGLAEPVDVGVADRVDRVVTLASSGIASRECVDRLVAEGGHLERRVADGVGRQDTGTASVSHDRNAVGLGLWKPRKRPRVVEQFLDRAGTDDPGLLETGLVRRSLPAIAPVCEEAACAPALVRPDLTSTIGVSELTSRAASMKPRPSPMSSK